MDDPATGGGVPSDLLGCDPRAPPYDGARACEPIHKHRPGVRARTAWL